MSKEKKILESWKKHWNSKSNLNNPMEIDGCCISGKPVEKEHYIKYWVAPVLSKLAIKKKDKVLDLGSGTGGFVNEIVKTNKLVVAVEQSSHSCSFISNKCVIINNSIEEINLLNKFDKILMIGVSHYFPSLKFFFNIILKYYHILDENGVLYIGDLLSITRNEKYLVITKQDCIEFLTQNRINFELIEHTVQKKEFVNNKYDLIIYR